MPFGTSIVDLLKIINSYTHNIDATPGNTQIREFKLILVCYDLFFSGSVRERSCNKQINQMAFKCMLRIEN